jgi:2-octaprenylphenol hydroxylase
MLLAQHYAKERVLLMGDAAHRIHPQAGQGLNIGLQDAAALAETIAEQQSSGQLQLADTEYIGQLLRAYERWRRSDDELMVRGVDQIGRLMRGTSPKAKLAGLGFSVVNKAWPLKDLFLRHAIGLSGTAPKVFRQAGSAVVSS